MLQPASWFVNVAVMGLMETMGTGPEPHIGPHPAGVDLLTLESLPGAEKVIFVKLEDVIDHDEFDPRDVWRIWQSAASGLSMFQVNVTTSPAVHEAAGMENSGILWLSARDCSRHLIPLDGFGYGKMACVHAFAGDAAMVGRTAVHELGPLLGLRLDGLGNVTDYFSGFPEFAWVPAMGDVRATMAWGEDALVQWSAGEYTDATNLQDDLATIERHLPRRADDIPGHMALVIADGGSIDPLDNRGQIAHRDDADHFRFSVVAPSATVKLFIDRTEVSSGSMLDVAAELIDAAGALVARHNAPAARWARLEAVVERGDYELVIRGGAEGTPEHGFSNYASLGFYAIAGDIVPEVDDDDGDDDGDDEVGETSSSETLDPDASDATEAEHSDTDDGESTDADATNDSLDSAHSEGGVDGDGAESSGGPAGEGADPSSDAADPNPMSSGCRVSAQFDGRSFVERGAIAFAVAGLWGPRRSPPRGEVVGGQLAR